MKIIHPKNIVSIFESLSQREWEEMPPFYTLEILPDVAREQKIKNALVKSLMHEYFAIRLRAAKILHMIGDPRGILHLTYAAMGVHPVLGVAQTSGYHDLKGMAKAVLLPYAEDLTNECISLLINDLHDPQGNHHFDLLSVAPKDKVFDVIIPLLNREKTALYAAYILALKGDGAGRSILKAASREPKTLGLALIALSHIPDQEVLELLKAASNLQPGETENNSEMLQRIALLSRQRLFYLENKNSQSFVKTMEKFFLKRATEIFSNHPSISPPDTVVLFIAGSWWSPSGTSVPDFMTEFSEYSDRQYCAEAQRRGIRTLLDKTNAGFSQLKDGNQGLSEVCMLGLPTLPEHGKRFYMDGVEIIFDRADYEEAAVDWILNPQKYCVGVDKFVSHI